MLPLAILATLLQLCSCHLYSQDQLSSSKQLWSRPQLQRSSLARRTGGDLSRAEDEGSKARIDFRYPDWVVEPQVECNHQGYFQHPRNCSWYYRCNDPYLMGYFRRSYYECAPGTYFDDKLDVCVADSGVGKSCEDKKLPQDCYVNDYGQCQMKEVCLDQDTKFQWSKLNKMCLGATYICPDEGSTPMPVCPTGMYFNIRNWICFYDEIFCENRNRPALPEELRDGMQCNDYFENCFDISRCTGYPSVVNRGYYSRLCSYKRECSWRGKTTTIDVCNGGYFDIYKEKCNYQTVAEICSNDEYITMNCKSKGVFCELTEDCKTSNTVYLCNHYHSCSLSYTPRLSGGICSERDYEYVQGSCVKNISMPTTEKNPVKGRIIMESCIETGYYQDNDPLPSKTTASKETPTTTTTLRPATETDQSCTKDRVGHVAGMNEQMKKKYCQPKFKCATNGDYLYAELYCPKFIVCMLHPATGAPALGLTNCKDTNSQLLLAYMKCSPPPNQEICNPKTLPGYKTEQSSNYFTAP